MLTLALLFLVVAPCSAKEQGSTAMSAVEGSTQHVGNTQNADADVTSTTDDTITSTVDALQEPNRLADDFVTASLLVADQGYFLFSNLGHMAMRLQCPYYNLDYTFSYEGERIENRLLSFLRGKLKMSVFAIQTSEYLEIYGKEKSGITEYIINLTPEQKLRLWEKMDTEMLSNQNIKYDNILHGCASTIREWLTEAIAPDTITYQYPLITNNSTIADIGIRNTHANWMQFLCTTVWGGPAFSEDLSDKILLYAPRELIYTWEQATLNGKPLLTRGERLLDYPPKEKFFSWPMFWGIVAIVLAIISLFMKQSYIDIALTTWQTLLGTLLLLAMLCRPVYIMGWSWLFIAFNPFAAIFWKWRSKWGLPYACMVIAWIIIVCCYPHVLATTAHLLFTAAFAIVALKPWIRKTVLHNTK